MHPGIFTHNPDLDPTGRNRAAVMKKCKTLNLDTEYIWYVKSQKAYHKEDTDCYYSYLSEFESWKGHRILSDRGTSFRVRGEDLFLSLGFDQHETFTPSVHGPLSINDGHLHSVAKAAWRQVRDDNGPEWERTLLLVHSSCITSLMPNQRASGRSTCFMGRNRQQKAWRNYSSKRKCAKMQTRNCGMTASPSSGTLSAKMMLGIYYKLF